MNKITYTHDDHLARFMDEARKFEKALERLTPREQHILNDRKIGENPKTLEELGEIFGVSRERIRQIEAKALNKLTKIVHTVAERRRLQDDSGWESAAEKAAA